MQVLHTADWHIGQLFHGYDRSVEHQQFLDWLVNLLHVQKIDVLLISGDVFDTANPSAASLRMFYAFLNKATSVNPTLQIVVTAGNHDSASRLESPKPLLESANVQIVGTVERDANGKLDPAKLLVPLRSKTGDIRAWCMAIPFLRMGDYPLIKEAEDPYAAGIAQVYELVYQEARRVSEPDQPIIAMGHLHTRNAEVSDLDHSERLIMGGIECLSASSFPPDICYVALGHIHKAQRIGGMNHIRYSGSPLPMSFAELNYKHQVLVVHMEGPKLKEINAVEVPLSVGLKRLPPMHSPLNEVVEVLAQLPSKQPALHQAPFIEVRVLLEGPEPSLRHQIENALADRHVRLAKIDVRYLNRSSPAVPDAEETKELNEVKPRDVFEKSFQEKYGINPPQDLIELFDQVVQEASETL